MPSYFFVAQPRFELRQTEPKSVVLPLYYWAITSGFFRLGCKNKGVLKKFQNYLSLKRKHF